MSNGTLRIGPGVEMSDEIRRRRGRMPGRRPTVILGCIFLLSLGVSNTHAQSIYGQNLFRNPGGEELHGEHAAEWGDLYSRPYSDFPGLVPPSDGGSRVLWGGYQTGGVQAIQHVQLQDYAAQVDTGKMRYSIGGYLGGYADQADWAYFRIDFYASFPFEHIATVETLPVTHEDRGDVTKLMQVSQSGLVPAGTRWIAVGLIMERFAGAHCDGMADSVYFELAKPEGLRTLQAEVWGGHATVEIDGVVRSEAAYFDGDEVSFRVLVEDGYWVEEATCAAGLYYQFDRATGQGSLVIGGDAYLSVRILRAPAPIVVEAGQHGEVTIPDQLIWELDPRREQHVYADAPGGRVAYVGPGKTDTFYLWGDSPYLTAEADFSEGGHYRIKSLTGGYSDKEETRGCGQAHVRSVWLDRMAGGTVRAEFEEVPQHRVTLEVRDGHGKVAGAWSDVTTASATNHEMHVDDGCLVAFDATPDAGYRVAEWNVNGVKAAGTALRYEHPAVTADMHVFVRFEVDPASVPGGGLLDPEDPLVQENCFIATAAYGSYLEPEVQTLRDFRDKYLMTHALGRHFVAWYYATSPALADVIAEHEWLRLAVRWMLTPVVYGVRGLEGLRAEWDFVSEGPR